MSSYLTIKDSVLKELSKSSYNSMLEYNELESFKGLTESDIESALVLLKEDGFISRSKSFVNITPKGREFISYTSYQNEYDKSYSKELYDTAAQNDYGTTRVIAVWAIIIAGGSLLIELIKLLMCQ